MAALVADEAVERGSVTVSGVPGDQAEALRAEIRKLMQRRGLRCGTRALDRIVFVWLESDPSPDRRAVMDAEALEAVSCLAAGEDVGSPIEDHTIHWSTWG